jgi:hypothetical protein
LKSEVATGRFQTARQVCAWVETTFGRRFSPSGMRKLLHRLGCSFHQVSGFLFKADPDRHQQFLEDYEQGKKVAQAKGWRRYFLDGVHPLYGLEVLFCCCPAAAPARAPAAPPAPTRSVPSGTPA